MASPPHLQGLAQAGGAALAYEARAKSRRRSVTLAGRRGLGRPKRGDELVGTGEVEVFAGELRRQDFDHRLVLKPDLDNMERPTVADKAFPALAARYLLDRVAIGRDTVEEIARREGWKCFVCDRG